MITRFGRNSCLLLIDVQVGVNMLQHWGGGNGRRNNPEAENKIRSLLKKFRDLGNQVAFTRHDSREASSPLKLSLQTGQQIDGLEI